MPDVIRIELDSTVPTESGRYFVQHKHKMGNAAYYVFVFEENGEWWASGNEFQRKFSELVGARWSRRIEIGGA